MHTGHYYRYAYTALRYVSISIDNIKFEFNDNVHIGWSFYSLDIHFVVQKFDIYNMH